MDLSEILFSLSERLLLWTCHAAHDHHFLHLCQLRLFRELAIRRMRFERTLDLLPRLVCTGQSSIWEVTFGSAQVISTGKCSYEEHEPGQTIKSFHHPYRLVECAPFGSDVRDRLLHRSAGSNYQGA